MGALMTEIGKGSRRVCFRLPDSRLCVKRYRDDGDVGGTVRREIARFRFDRCRNTCAREYDYIRSLETKLPPEVFAVFPETMELKEDPVYGWQIVESLVLNGDGSMPERFSFTCRAADAETRRCLLAAFRNLAHAFEAAAVKFYDPQNVLVQWEGKPFEGDFRLRIVDFEPASRTFLPIDSLCPAFRRMKLRRRVKRYLWQHVAAKYEPLPWRERTKWDALVKEEGERLGLSGCRMFLENKIVNDIFYEGMFKGRPCVVKCSSRAPDSIRNEYEMLKRVHGADAAVFPEPYALWTSQDGRKAFVAMEKVGGGRPSDPAADIMRIANALKDAGIVHRDISTINVLCGEDGHLKLIDFQFAIDRNDYRESRFMRRNPKYLYVHFGSCEELGLGRWNDILGLGLLRCLFHFAPNATDVESKLREMAASMTFSAPVAVSSRIRIRCYCLSLWIQSLFVASSSVKWRLYKSRLLLAGGGGGFSTPRQPVSFSFCISDSYAQHLAVVLASLLENNPGVPFVFHVLHRDIKPETEAKVRRLESMYINHRIIFHKIDASAFDSFPIPKTLAHITQEMYYRYLLPDLLKDERRTIYSDVDVLCVAGNVRELWDMDLVGKPIAAIRKDSGNDAHYVAHMERMGVPRGSTYFFSGMFVMDLDALRRERFTEKCMAKTVEKADELIFPDMDVINAVMLDRITEIDPAWNMTKRFSFFCRGVKMWHFVCQTQKPWCCLWKNTTWIPYLRYLVKTPYASNAFKFVWGHIMGFFFFKYTKNMSTRYLVCGLRVWKHREVCL